MKDKEQKIENIKTTSEKWYSFISSKIRIIDYDGWDRQDLDYSFNVEKITAKAFMQRLLMSTIEYGIEASMVSEEYLSLCAQSFIEPTIKNK